jgi:hypothetical protein
MREREELTDEECETLNKVLPKALRMINARDVRIRRFENELHFCVGKLDRIDELPTAWEEESDETGDAGRRIALCELGEEIADILGGYRERVARLRAEGILPPRDEESASDMQEMMEDFAREMRERRRYVVGVMGERPEPQEPSQSPGEPEYDREGVIHPEPSRRPVNGTGAG